MYLNNYIDATFQPITSVNLVKLNSQFVGLQINGTRVGAYPLNSYNFEYDSNGDIRISTFNFSRNFGLDFQEAPKYVVVNPTTLQVNGVVCTSIADFETKWGTLVP